MSQSSPNHRMTKAAYTALADGISRGRSLTSIAGAVGVDRSTLRSWLANGETLTAVARSIGSPDALGDALSMLLTLDRLPGERPEARGLRREFCEIVREVHARWFRQEREREERRCKAEQLKREADARKAEAKAERQREADERAEECLRADYVNLQTLVMIHAREWADGTPDELKRGLDTSDARRQYRCVRGLRFSCAGFGSYYAPSWGPCRCRMQYEIEDAGGGAHGFRGVAGRDEYADAWAEIDAEGEHGEHYRDPFARRDRRLPTREADARALYEFIKGGGTFVEWKPQTPRKASK